MHIAHIGSVNTYTKCIKQLHEWGYIEYFPSFHPDSGSKVTCISFDKSSDKAGDNAADKAFYKNTNITNGIKQRVLQNLKNGKEKQPGRSNPLHVETDKDYSEPL